MVYVTGDTHGSFRRFSTKLFPEQREMTRDDVVIILGDFGGIWNPHETAEERYNLDWLNDKSFTLCFVDGNHENFDRLYADEYPIVSFHGGMAHKIREHVIHLMRGCIFNFDGKDFFVTGGAASHDICDGILDPESYSDPAEFKQEYKKWRSENRMFRVNHLTWWEQEIPSDAEFAKARQTLTEHNWMVDYVLAHCLPNSIASYIGIEDTNKLTLFFDGLLEDGLSFTQWHCGYYHMTNKIPGKYNIHYHDIERIL